MSTAREPAPWELPRPCTCGAPAADHWCDRCKAMRCIACHLAHPCVRPQTKEKPIIGDKDQKIAALKNAVSILNQVAGQVIKGQIVKGPVTCGQMELAAEIHYTCEVLMAMIQEEVSKN